MRSIAVATVVVVLLCLALAPCVADALKQQLNTVDDTKQVGDVGVLAGSRSSSGASWPDLDDAAFENLWQPVEQRRSLKKVKLKTSSKAKKKKGPKWAKGNVTLWGSVIGVATVVAVVAVVIVFLLVTERTKQHPKWYLFNRRVKPGVRRAVTRAFTRKSKPTVGDDVDDTETKKMPDDPPKLKGSEASSIS